MIPSFNGAIITRCAMPLTIRIPQLSCVRTNTVMGDLENAAVSRPGGYRLQIRAAEARVGCIIFSRLDLSARRSGRIHRRNLELRQIDVKLTTNRDFATSLFVHNDEPSLCTWESARNCVGVIVRRSLASPKYVFGTPSPATSLKDSREFNRRESRGKINVPQADRCSALESA